LVKIEIIAVGKDKDRWVSEGAAHFEKLLGKFARIEWITITAEKGKSLSPAQIKKAEAARLLGKIDKGLIIALHDRGTKLDSMQLAAKLERWLGQCNGRIVFVIGGAFGLDETVLNRADMMLSLSRLTFSHQVVRIVLMEQLYRAFSILYGSDYHK